MPRDSLPADQDGYRADPMVAAPAGAGLPRGQGRHFLFVCGPFGAFTRTLGRSLRGEGARCSRVILNGGDVFDWGVFHASPYFGPREGFGDWFAALTERSHVTDVVIYGDSHPYCVEAARVGARRSLTVHVLEQGYFRPFWITLERGGVNGNSSLPRDPRAYLEEARGIPAPAEEWLPPLTPPAAWNLALYHAVLWLATPAFAQFQLPYQYSLPRQALGHARRYLAQRLFRGRRRRWLASALNAEGELFLGILQRPGDSQLRVHSPFPSTAEFVTRVVESFSRHAPASARLLFKSHLLDHGIEPHARSVATAAAAHGVVGRVLFTDSGDLHAMLPKATGVITVNSTAGLSAVGRGLPTVALGQAVYDMPGLTHQGGLDSFWAAPQAPEPSLYDAFRRVVVGRTQISGAYAVREGVERAVPEVTRRLLS